MKKKEMTKNEVENHTRTDQDEASNNADEDNEKMLWKITSGVDR